MATHIVCVLLPKPCIVCTPSADLWHLPENCLPALPLFWLGTLSVSCLQIGRILEIKRPIRKSQGAEAIKVNVAWFYRPEESLGGRKASALSAFGAHCCTSPAQTE